MEDVDAAIRLIRRRLARPVAGAACTAVAMLAMSLVVGVLSAAAAEAGKHRRSRIGHADACHVPRLTGLVVASARSRAAKAGCRVRFLGAPVERPDVQTIRRQSRPGQRRRIVTLWVNPVCPVSADPGPPRGEPFVTPGPAELVSGLYLDGGPLFLRSVPNCASISGTPGAGTITVTDPVTGAVVASKNVADGQLGVIQLAPGTYTVVGTFANATSNGQPKRSPPETVTIPSDSSVRRDLEVSIK
jgi:hypothetical protein